jgi:putative ABC transport system ATP-binding protein
MSGDVLIETEHLCKQYDTGAGPVPVLKDVNVTVRRGEFVAVMGPSGSGKTTFMNILGCLDLPTSGRYVLDGRDAGTLDGDALAQLRNAVIGFVFQGYNLLPRATLVDNVALPLLYAGVAHEERARRAEELLDKMGLSGYGRYAPSQVSGGQQQRVAIARAMINNPRLILADEPTGNLDTKTSYEIMKLLAQLNAQGITIVLVTHEPDIAAYAKRLVRFVDGHITHDGNVSGDTIKEMAT